MARVECGRLGLLVGAIFFLVLHMRLFAVQTNYANRIAQAVEGENACTQTKRAQIDQYSSQQGRIVALEEENERLENKYAQLSVLIQDHSFKMKGKLTEERSNQLNSPVDGPIAAVVIMACNRPDYLDRTLKSVLKYQQPVANKFPVFVSQVHPFTAFPVCNHYYLQKFDKFLNAGLQIKQEVAIFSKYLCIYLHLLSGADESSWVWLLLISACMLKVMISYCPSGNHKVRSMCWYAAVVEV